MALPAQVTSSHAVALFNEERYHALNLGPGQLYLHVGHEAGSVAGVAEADTFTCGWRAPFGGLDTQGDDMPALADFVDHVLDELDEFAVVRLHLRPACYSPAEPIVEHLLLNAGLCVEHCAINQHLDLSGFADAEAYLASLKKKVRWGVRKDIAEEPYEFSEARDDASLAECHTLLQANRLLHGRPAGLTLDYVRQLREAFAGSVRMYRLAHAGRAVAAAIVYRVLPGCDVVQSWGDHGHSLDRSPMNLLAYRVVEASLSTGARLLDIGPSSEKDGTPNPGLFRFKRSLGAQAGTRLVLVR